MIARVSQGTLQCPTNLLRSCDKILRKYSELKMVKDAWKAFFNIIIWLRLGAHRPNNAKEKIIADPFCIALHEILCFFSLRYFSLDCSIAKVLRSVLS